MSQSNSERLIELKAVIESGIKLSLALEDEMDEFTQMRRLWEEEITQPLRDASDFIERIERRKKALGLT